MLGHFPAQIIFPDCSNPVPGELLIYLPPLLFVPYQHRPDKKGKGEIRVLPAPILPIMVREQN